MLHHDNAPPYDSLFIREFLAKQETIVVLQPTYSPDLAPADFFLFPKLKSTLKGRRFQTVEEMKENSLQDLRAIPRNTFQDAFQNCIKCWERCINSRGKYFEGDKSDYVVSTAINLKKSSVYFWTALVHTNLSQEGLLIGEQNTPDLNPPFRKAHVQEKIAQAHQPIDTHRNTQ